MRISIQGNLGSYSHIAAKYFSNDRIGHLFERDSFDKVFEDLANGSSDFAVVPVENSTYGSVVQNIDLIIKNDFHILAEVYLRINLHLISFSGSKVENIKKLYSHPVAFGQIGSFLRAHKTIVPIEYNDTAGAVKMLKEQRLADSAAVASKTAAEVYGLEIIQKNIHENKRNYTRFLLLSKNQSHEKAADKLSLLFQLKNETRDISSALYLFRGRKISKIDSRPIPNTKWEHLFWLDVDNDIEETKDAIQELSKISNKVRILGIYKCGEYIDT